MLIFRGVFAGAFLVSSWDSILSPGVRTWEPKNIDKLVGSNEWWYSYTVLYNLVWPPQRRGNKFQGAWGWSPLQQFAFATWNVCIFFPDSWSMAKLYLAWCDQTDQFPGTTLKAIHAFKAILCAPYQATSRAPFQLPCMEMNALYLGWEKYGANASSFSVGFLWWQLLQDKDFRMPTSTPWGVWEKNCIQSQPGLLGTMDIFFAIMRWSFESMFNGTWPSHDWRGCRSPRDSKEGKRAGKPLANGWSGCLVQPSGDLDDYSKWFQTPRWSNHNKPCSICKATYRGETTGWTQAGRAQLWPSRHLEVISLQHALSSNFLVWLLLFMSMDWMHCHHLGWLEYLFGSVFGKKSSPPSWSQDVSKRHDRRMLHARKCQKHVSASSCVLGSMYGIFTCLHVSYGVRVYATRFTKINQMYSNMPFMDHMGYAVPRYSVHA